MKEMKTGQKISRYYIIFLISSQKSLNVVSLELPLLSNVHHNICFCGEKLLIWAVEKKHLNCLISPQKYITWVLIGIVSVRFHNIFFVDKLANSISIFKASCLLMLFTGPTLAFSAIIRVTSVTVFCTIHVFVVVFFC